MMTSIAIWCYIWSNRSGQMLSQHWQLINNMRCFYAYKKKSPKLKESATLWQPVCNSLDICTGIKKFVNQVVEQDNIQYSMQGVSTVWARNGIYGMVNQQQHTYQSCSGDLEFNCTSVQSMQEGGNRWLNKAVLIDQASVTVRNLKLLE